MRSLYSSSFTRICKYTLSYVALCFFAGSLLLPAQAIAAPKAVPPCLSPAGTNLNVLYDVNHSLVAPFCAELGSGRSFSVLSNWFMGTTFDSVPSNFVAAGDTPAEDFVAKFEAATYVFDSGTTQEKSYVVPSSEELVVRETDDFAAANTVRMATFKPLSDGVHTIEVYLSFSSMHCDGLGNSTDDNCLGPGSVLFDSFEIEVVPGH